MGQITGLAFTPDGKKLLSSSEADGTVRVWHLGTRKILHTFRGFEGMFGSMAISPDGKTVVLGTIGPTLQLWDLDSGKELFTEYQGHHSWINSLAYSPDGKSLVSAEGGEFVHGGLEPAVQEKFGQVFSWDTTTWKNTRISAEGAHVVAFSPKGNHLASLESDRAKVRIWNFAAGTESPAILLPNARWENSFIFLPDGLKLVTCDRASALSAPPIMSVRHWDIANGMQEHVWTLACRVDKRRFWPSPLAPDGRTFAAVQDNDLIIYNTQTGQDRIVGAWKWT